MASPFRSRLYNLNVDRIKPPRGRKLPSRNSKNFEPIKKFVIVDENENEKETLLKDLIQLKNEFDNSTKSDDDLSVKSDDGVYITFQEINQYDDKGCLKAPVPLPRSSPVSPKSTTSNKSNLSNKVLPQIPNQQLQSAFTNELRNVLTRKRFGIVDEDEKIISESVDNEDNEYDEIPAVRIDTSLSSSSSSKSLPSLTSIAANKNATSVTLSSSTSSLAVKTITATLPSVSTLTTTTISSSSAAKSLPSTKLVSTFPSSNIFKSFNHFRNNQSDKVQIENIDKFKNNNNSNSDANINVSNIKKTNNSAYDNCSKNKPSRLEPKPDVVTLTSRIAFLEADNETKTNLINNLFSELETLSKEVKEMKSSLDKLTLRMVTKDREEKDTTVYPSKLRIPKVFH